jgi:cytochrome c biogenesis protein CcmG, thiol:disulfide interchange protein DsbE
MCLFFHLRPNARPRTPHKSPPLPDTACKSSGGKAARRQADGRVCFLLTLAGVLVVAALGGCGGDQPRRAAPAGELEAALKGAPPALERLYSRPNQVVDGGTGAFRRQLEELHGYPVVVNKWASWCHPCRSEFPLFQRVAAAEGKQVAFLAVDSLDSKDGARRFLERYPVPYPSYFDPDGKIARLFRGDRVSPTTAFYDRRGQLVLTKQGQYRSARALAADVARYTR